MIIIVLFIVGVVVLFKKRVAISKKSEIRRPRTYILGVIAIVSAILAQILAFGPEKFGTASGGILSLLWVFIPLFAAIAMKQPKLEQ